VPEESEPFRVTVLYKPRHDGVEATIVLEGELDMSGTTLFWAYANEALGCRPRSIVVDAADLTFIDSAGVMRCGVLGKRLMLPVCRLSSPEPRDWFGAWSSCSGSTICFGTANEASPAPGCGEMRPRTGGSTAKVPGRSGNDPCSEVPAPGVNPQPGGRTMDRQPSLAGQTRHRGRRWVAHMSESQGPWLFARAAGRLSLG
jgi:hypothetical protein